MKKLIFLLLLSFAIIWSCKKNESNNSTSSNPSVYLMKGMSFYDSIGNFIMSQSMEYNSQSQIVLMKSYYPKQYDTILTWYEYNSSRVIERHYDTNNVLKYKYIYELNGLGLASSRTYVNYLSSGDSSVTLDATYIYNSDGFMIESKFHPIDTLHWFKINYQISEGNIFSQLYSDNYGSGSLNVFTFFPNTINTIGNFNAGITWLGKSNQELIKTSANKALTPDSMFYNYTVDSQSRVIIKKFREQHPSVGSVDLRITYY